LSINIDVFTIYCFFEYFSNLVLEILYSFDIVFRKSSYTYINKNNVVLFYKTYIGTKLLI